MELNNSQTNDGKSLEERFEQLSRRNQQQNERFEKLLETMDQRFTVMMEALKNLTQDKRKYREGKHIAAQTCQKWTRTSVECPQVVARTSVESPEEQQESSHQVSDDNFVENSSDTWHYGVSDEEEFQEESIILDQQNLAHENQELCSGYQDDQNIGSSEVLLNNISQEFSSKEELGKRVSDKL